ncbi:Hybrid sensor histidine kinase/response regulator [Pseudomonas sp. 8AS]|uniref:PAS domain-containing hybrid sensor histidine kinase/response regulator n=1 Tax=Pseudomonas sp. 8AS TaxID=2653163 RepID=UPI0012F057A0|nr:NahK/ErcS family hybrid sensor histidine kinase/response regulator [Pseudomonas sp. 8AS]VXC08587.1 Hybrid sensor histidine kinase/response regulator [Pseudomonas sp. 8AS]
MQKRSEQQQQALAGLLGLGSQSARKSHYAELVTRLEELETERNRYKWLFENAVHGIFQASLHEGLRAANPALARMLGYDNPQQVLWSLTDLAEHLFVGGQAELVAIREVLASQPGLYGYETRLRRKDGRVIDVLMNILLKPDEPGLFEGFVADISERKQAQQRLQQLNEELEQRVAQRTTALLGANQSLHEQIGERVRVEQELRKARDAAEEANRSKDKYLAAASHDLLQPLNAARLLISTLRERELGEAAHNLVERAHQALEGAEDLLSDLLDIAKLDQAAIKPDLDVYRLDELLAPLASEFEPLATQAGLRLRARIPACTVRTDARLLNRILRNFLSNACRYTEHGGVLLGVRKRGEQLRIEVWDSGRGIPADQLQAVFREFHQLDVGRSMERKGVGLGLAIVERIARMLGYPIEVRSRPGRGSCFSIQLPLVAAQAPLPSSRPAAQAQVGNPLPGKRLLVLDNEPSILHSMAELLGGWGCEVLTALDQVQALEVLDERAPDLLLVDYHLDLGVTGSEVVQALRAHFARDIPAVMITAERSDECRLHLQALKVPLLNKPVRPGKLRAVLSQMLAG